MQMHAGLHAGNTSSRTITEVKQRVDRLEFE